MHIDIGQEFVIGGFPGMDKGDTAIPSASMVAPLKTPDFFAMTRCLISQPIFG
jgi:hypothetical protein